MKAPCRKSLSFTLPLKNFAILPMEIAFIEIVFISFIEIRPLETTCSLFCGDSFETLYKYFIHLANRVSLELVLRDYYI